jgi:LEA14-like dessication related protein
MEPEFTITSITILQADLINTRMKLSLKIDNPNIFPINLASFKYDLYGDGNFWTGGTEKDLATIQAQGSSETEFNIEMNFINMKRRLLDDIIAMRYVHYRIVGTMEVGADIPGLPGIRVKFDYSGDSAVKK